MIKQFLLLILVSFHFLNAYAQNGLNRLYINMGYGYPGHNSFGVMAHGMDLYTAGLFYSSTVKSVGPLENKPGPFGITYQEGLQKNRLDNISIAIGMTTKSLRMVDASIVVGPSIGFHTVYSDFAQVKDTAYSVTVWTYNMNRYTNLGLTVRGDCSIAFFKPIGLNFALEGNLNPYQPYFRAILGVNFGVVRDISTFKKAP